jgi:hypothetical protein
VATPGLAFYAFDHAYLDRLRSGDHETKTHFVAYFSKLIEVKLRSRLRTRQAIEDVQRLPLSGTASMPHPYRLNGGNGEIR